MPLLHVHLNSSDTEIDIGRDVKAQSIILRKVVIMRNPLDADPSGDNSASGVLIDLHKMFNGSEMLSSLSNGNHLYVPCVDRNYQGSGTPSQLAISEDFNIRMNSEDIPRKFSIAVYKRDGTTLHSFTSSVDGHIDTIDIYFEYETHI